MVMTTERISDTSQTKTNLVIFKLNRVQYAIAIEQIQQIIEMVTITPVLKTEAWMEGIINYHGVSIPVVNLRRHFGMEVIPYRWHTPIILVDIVGHQVGLIVDDVLDVSALSREQIVDPRAILPTGIPDTPLLKGIIQTEQDITLLLDLTHLFDQVQVRALNAAASALGEKPAQEPPEKTRPEKPAAKKRGNTSKEKTAKAAATPRRQASAKKAELPKDTP